MTRISQTGIDRIVSIWLFLGIIGLSNLIYGHSNIIAAAIGWTIGTIIYELLRKPTKPKTTTTTTITFYDEDWNKIGGNMHESTSRLGRTHKYHHHL